MDISNVKLLFGAVHSNRVYVESVIFRLNSHLTSVGMLVALFVATTAVFVSKPILCDGDRNKPQIDMELINTHCHLHGTYRYVDFFYLEHGPGAIGYQVLNQTVLPQLYPGILPYPGIFYSNVTRGHFETVLLNYTYFNWLFVTFFLMAISSYFPYFLWELKEGGRMKVLISKISYFDSNGFEDATAKAKKIAEEKLFARYVDHSLGNHGSYMRAYFVCEVLAMSIFALQNAVLNKMFHGRWFLYGYEVVLIYFDDNLHHLIDTDANPFVMVFPKRTKCTYSRYGFTGAIDKRNFLCTMSLNNFHDKFFLLFWFWCLFQIALFICCILYRLRLFIPYMRYRAIKQLIAYELDTKNIFKIDLQEFICQISFADWFVLYHMGCNIDPLNFYEALAVTIKYRKEKCRRFTMLRTEKMIETSPKVRNRKVKALPIKIEEET